MIVIRNIRLKIKENERFFKISVIVILILISFFLEIIFINILNSNIFFPQFFYLPSVLACFWWKKKGLIIPVFLASLLIFFPIFTKFDMFINFLIKSLIRSSLLLSVSIAVAYLSNNYSKKQQELIHINSLLHAIRNVNQLITRVKSRERLLQGSCDLLVETRGYFNVWIALIDESHRVICTAEAGLKNRFLPIVKILKKGEFSNCRTAMTQSDVVITKDPSSTCIDCPLAKSYEGRSGMTCRLEHMDKIFGLITVSIPKEMIVLEEEHKLFKEVADEIALALSNISREEKRKEFERNYKEAYHRAEFYKDIFAHDISNILQAILSGIQLNEIYINNPIKIEKLKEINKITKDQVKKGADLVSNIRKLSQLEASETNIHQIEICNILKNTIAYLQNVYQDKNINIQADSIGEKFYVYANNLLEDVFNNILNNSVRHNENLLVEITIKISKELKESKNYLKIEFIDNGIGVEDKRKAKIFQRGYYEDESIHGMGLGLSLVKKILDLYGGEIWVENRVKGDHSKGSNFIILIPELA